MRGGSRRAAGRRRRCGDLRRDGAAEARVVVVCRAAGVECDLVAGAPRVGGGSGSGSARPGRRARSSRWRAAPGCSGRALLRVRGADAAAAGARPATRRRGCCWRGLRWALLPPFAVEPDDRDERGLRAVPGVPLRAGGGGRRRSGAASGGEQPVRCDCGTAATAPGERDSRGSRAGATHNSGIDAQRPVDGVGAGRRLPERDRAGGADDGTSARAARSRAASRDAAPAPGTNIDMAYRTRSGAERHLPAARRAGGTRPHGQGAERVGGADRRRGRAYAQAGGAERDRAAARRQRRAWPQARGAERDQPSAAAAPAATGATAAALGAILARRRRRRAGPAPGRCRSMSSAIRTPIRCIRPGPGWRGRWRGSTGGSSRRRGRTWRGRALDGVRRAAAAVPAALTDAWGPGVVWYLHGFNPRRGRRARRRRSSRRRRRWGTR